MTVERKYALLMAGSILATATALTAFSFLGARHSRSGGGTETGSELAPVPVASEVELPGAAAAGIVTDAPPVSAGTPEEAASFRVEPGLNYLQKGIESYRAGEFAHAAAYLQAETEARPDRAYPHYLLGLAQWKSGRLDEAAASLRRSIEIDGTSVKTLVNLSRVENDRGEFDEALEAARTALGLAADDPQALFLEGRSLRNLGDRSAALASLHRSVEIDAENGYARNLLGLTLLETGEVGAAVEMLTAASERLPEVAYVQNNLGMALERGGRREEALAAYRRAVTADPARANASRNLARLEAVIPREPGEELLAVVPAGSGETPTPEAPQN